MPTLSDAEFIAQGPEIEKQLESALKASETSAPVETPPVETPPAAETPPVETPAPAAAEAPPSETPPAAETPAGEAPAEGETPPTEPDYKAVYNRLFGQPIRAAGQDIVITTPDEAISLMQKGVGFHSKMNKVHNDLKYVEMLRNNGLLDEGKLGLLIDAQANKPGAIKKLLDSVQVDPLSLDSAEASTYAPSDHRVSDEQVQFQAVVSDLSASTPGKAVLSDAAGWDQASKAEVYRTPDVLNVLAQQKEMGRYDLIVAEIARAKVLGHIPANEGFLSAYTRVGQQMMQAGKFGDPPASTPTPVAQKTVTPPAPANSKKAAAAAPTKVTTPGAKPEADIKVMTDAEFEVHFRKTLKI